SDNGLGDLTAPLVDLLRTQPRFLLAQGPLAGAASEWRGPAGVQIVAGAGEPGLYEGIRVPTFQTLGGSAAALGAQWAPTSQLSFGGELATARDVALYYQTLDPVLPAISTPSERISSTTAVLSGAWQSAGTRAQLNLIDGTLAGNPKALGAWLDVSHGGAGLTQSFGAFRIDPHLAWGNQLITSDVQGGYYRLDYQSRRWLADVGVDQVRSVSGLGSSITFINAAARYQLSRDDGVGAVLNLRRSSGPTAWSLEGYVDEINSRGTARLQLDDAQQAGASDSSITLQQSWSVRAGARLSTTAAIEHIRGGGVPGAPQDATIARLACYGGGDLTARLALDGSIQWAAALAGRAPLATSADISLTWQVARHWSTLLSYYANRVAAWTPLLVSSPLAPPTAAPQAAVGERGIFLTIRFQSAQGAHFVPLGGGPGSGSGRLSGVVFLDANENGRFDAGESGAANVTVVLDGRYSVRTDANGRFDFPAVASGVHELTVQSDNLPLPWTVTDFGRTTVQVSTRERTEVTIGALRRK
ncbi:MAG: hypothetical protein JO341_02875, partial [Gammaproteobacteria bacterium]|nr:hypothetical protein [Gammaproteobacteria bacterium]